MKIRKSKKVIGTTKFSPPVGYQIAPSAPAGGGTNVAAMRATFAFLPYNQDEVNKRIYTAKAAFLSANQTKSEDDFEGIDDPYGRGVKIGKGKNVIAAEQQATGQKSCTGGYQYDLKSGSCICPDDSHIERHEDGSSFCLKNYKF
jgi:hypothetical protein